MQPGAPPPAKSSGCLKWGCIGCGAVLLLGCVFLAGIVVFVFGAIKHTDVYTGAVRRVQQDSRVTAAIGSPVETGWWLMGNVNVDNNGGHADFTFPVHGPNGKASVHTVATKESGNWIYTELTVTPDGGQPIDLLKP